MKQTYLPIDPTSNLALRTNTCQSPKGFVSNFLCAVSLLVALMVWTPVGSAATTPPAGRLAPSADLFSYDRSLPFSMRVLAQSRQGGIAIREVSFAVTPSSRMTAYIVAPTRSGRYAGIVFEPGRWQTRDYFLSEALDDARRGAVGVSLDDLSIGYPTFTGSDRATLILRVIALRRAVDLLLAQPGVDATRLGFVGHSDGAELGGMLAGIDRHIRAYVLMSGGGIWDRSRDTAYNDAIAQLDADNYIPYAQPAALLYQSARHDQFVPVSDALHYQQLGSRPKQVEWYNADHMLNAQARSDRQAWLGAQLRLH